MEEYDIPTPNKHLYDQHESDCGTPDEDWSWRYDTPNREGIRYCSICGWIDPFYKDFDDSAPITYYNNDNRSSAPKKRRRVSKEVRDEFRQAGIKFDRGGGICSKGVGYGEGRYKAKFHLNERIAQWCMEDPQLPEGIWECIYEKSCAEEYGPPRYFTRATVIKILKDSRLLKYRERWKSILHKLNPEVPLTFPTQEVREYIISNFERWLREFYDLKTTMPLCLSKGKEGKMMLRVRHNFLSFNYVIRKILESVEIYEWQSEFPLPISIAKLIALDNIAEKICERIRFPFTRSVLIKRPKFKRTKKQRLEIREERQKYLKEANEFFYENMETEGWDNKKPEKDKLYDSLGNSFEHIKDIK